jgi:hypothetical protein
MKYVTPCNVTNGSAAGNGLIWWVRSEAILLYKSQAESTVLRVEAISNTSTVALRVVGGDGKGTQCLGI